MNKVKCKMNLIHHCPKCFYELVLLDKRAKYKCAKCSNLYLQKFIENKSFRIWNERQRILVKEEYERLKKSLIKVRPQLSDEEKKERAIIFRKKYYEENKLKVKELYDNWRKENREYYNQKVKERYWKNIEKSRYRVKLKNLRKQQKILALQMLENLQEKPSNDEILISFPT